MATWGLGLGTRGRETQGRETRRRETQGRGTRGRGTWRRGTWRRGTREGETRRRGTRGRGTRGRGRGILGTHGTRGRDKQTTPDICADFVEYNFRWSRLAVADGFQRLETVKNIVSSYGGLSL